MAANARIGLGPSRIERRRRKKPPQEGNCHPDNRNNEPTQDYSRFSKEIQSKTVENAKTLIYRGKKEKDVKDKKYLQNCGTQGSQES